MHYTCWIGTFAFDAVGGKLERVAEMKEVPSAMGYNNPSSVQGSKGGGVADVIAKYLHTFKPGSKGLTDRFPTRQSLAEKRTFWLIVRIVKQEFCR